MRKQIPNLITLLNLLAGAVTITLIFRGEYLLALVPAAASQLFDFGDGLSARLLDARSAMGRELDSMADLISFGAAPAFLLFRLLQEAGNEGIVSYLALAYLAAAAWRLAQFSIDERQSSSFRGLATPPAAIMVMTLPLIPYSTYFNGTRLLSDPVFLVIMVLLPSILMVSGIRLFSLKAKSLRFSENAPVYILLVILALLLLIQWPLAGLALVPVYILLSLLFRKRIP